MNAFRKSARRMLGVALLFLFSGAASAVTTAGAASSIVLPVAAKTSSFETEVFVFNHNAYVINVDVLYYEANGLAAPGQKTCSVLSLAAGETKSFKLATQCPVLNDNPPQSHFGLLVLRDAGGGSIGGGRTEKLRTFYGYSRVQHVTTLQGFSIEGFPEHVFSGSLATSTGLKRNGASPFPGTPYLYQSNCFVGSLGDPVNYRIRLYNGSGTKIGNDIIGSLAPYQLLRYLDIFTVAGLAVGELDNIRAQFEETNNVNPLAPDDGGRSLIGFCTVQDNRSFGADFRIAKSLDAANATLRKLRCRGTGVLNDANLYDGTACPAVTSPAVHQIPDATKMDRWEMFVHHPDFLKCKILGDPLVVAKLEIRLLAPSGEQVAGGKDQTEFYIETGGRQSAFTNSYGVQTFWTTDIQARSNVTTGFPLGYGLQCNSGSGMHLTGVPREDAREALPWPSPSP